MSFITIFTPTYNRRKLIERLYQSLLTQTQKNFEWLVVDDGSTDDTESFFKELLSKTSPFSIRYIKQENGGKHRAINKGVKVAKGELFFTVDSDDYLTDNAIERVNAWRESLDKSHKWAGVAGLRGYNTTDVIGERNNTALFIDAKNTERRQYNLQGDKPEIYFTDVLKEFPFPEIPGENFISEEIVSNTLARNNYYMRWFNEIIYIGDYLKGGLTNNKEKHSRNPRGCLLWTINQISSFPNDWRKRFLAIGIYHSAVKKQQGLKKTALDLNQSFIKVALSYFMIAIYVPLFNLFKKTFSHL